MDDFLGSVADSNEELNLSKELVKLLSLGGFKLTKPSLSAMSQI